MVEREFLLVCGNVIMNVVSNAIIVASYYLYVKILLAAVYSYR